MTSFGIHFDMNTKTFACKSSTRFATNISSEKIEAMKKKKYKRDVIC